MYFWKTDKLAEAIKSGNVSERDWKGYYLATNIFWLVSVYISILSPRTGGIALLLLEAAFIIAVTILGINITFKTNEVSGGGDYISRVTAFGFPIMIKIFIVGIFFGVFVKVLSSAHLIGESIAQVSFTIFTVLAQAFFFLRINFYLKSINT